MFKCKFINCNKYTTLVGDVDNGRLCVYGSRGYKPEKSVLSDQFCHESKITLKIKKDVYICLKFFSKR